MQLAGVYAQIMINGGSHRLFIVTVTAAGALGVAGSPALAYRLPWRRGSRQKYYQLVPDAAGNTGQWCRTFKPMG